MTPNIETLRSDAERVKARLDGLLEGTTPGPWTIIPAEPYEGDDDSLTGSFVMPASIEGADGNPVCMFGDCFGSGQLYENEADHSLIAASPDTTTEASALITRLLDALDDARGWQPIETAPESDDIMLWARSDNSIKGAKIGDLAHWSDPEIHICSFSYIDDSGSRVYRSTELDGWGEMNMRLWATHWMPLPAPPALSDEREG